MHLSKLQITGVGGIDDLSLSFDRGMNIICGPNGIGKSTILDAIAHSFSLGQTNILKVNAKAKKSEVTAKVVREEKEVDIRYQLQTEPDEIQSFYAATREVMLFRVNRTFVYRALDAVSRDTQKQDPHYWEELRSGITLHDTKNWFVNRYLYSAHKGALTDVQLKNFETATKCFAILDENFQFDGVEASTNEIMVQTPGGRIYYEYLSSGFKSCLSIMFAMIKEIEFRFPGKSAADFDGIVLIDELEIHLHPVWQSRIASYLMELFPNCQFIATTHSPHIIQSAEPQQIIALERVANVVRQRDLPTSAYGFKHWTLDEVLMDVMGMDDTRSEDFVSKLAEFDAAVDAENYDAAQKAYAIFDGSLHPNNNLRKLLKLQLATIPHANDKA